jgi:hypothetical protein
MLSEDIFKSIGCYINTELIVYTKSLINLINHASENRKVEISSLLFTSTKEFDISKVTMRTIIDCGIPIFDFIIYQNLSEEDKKKIKWVIDSKRKIYTETEISFSTLFIYFMLITRNKVFPEKHENIPSFLLRFMITPMTVDDVKECLSNNNLSLFSHVWIKDIKISKLTDSLKNRIKQGIAGMRLFTVISENEPDKNINSNLSQLVDNIKFLINRGPYWEMHTLFQTSFLNSQSINANLNNLLIDLYSFDKLEQLVLNKSIFKMPKFNPRAIQYLQWSDNFFSEFKEVIKFVD